RARPVKPMPMSARNARRLFSTQRREGGKDAKERLVQVFIYRTVIKSLWLKSTWTRFSRARCTGSADGATVAAGPEENAASDLELASASVCSTRKVTHV